MKCLWKSWVLRTLESASFFVRALFCSGGSWTWLMYKHINFCRTRSMQTICTLVLAFACFPPSFQREGELQWGTKVLRHFCKMPVFSIVNMYLSSSPMFPHPLSPKSMLYFQTLKSFFYFIQRWFRGGEINNI